MLDQNAIEEIAGAIRSGLYERDELVDGFCDKWASVLSREDVAATIDAEFAKWEMEKQTWPEVTDCDRLDSAFAAMNERGLIALQNAGYTQSDGYDDFRDALESHPNKSLVVGYCFYHGQDLERAMCGKGLYFAFGPVDPKDENSKGPEIGKIVREELERVGFQVDWDGRFGTRLSVPKITWQRR